MTDGEKKMLELLLDYQYNLRRLDEIKEKLESKTYRITPSYSSTGGGSGGKTSRSKVEDFAEKRLKLLESARKYEEKIRQADAIMNSKAINNFERSLLQWIAGGGRLSAFAEKEGIYLSRVYKMRDKALKTACEALQGIENSVLRL